MDLQEPYSPPTTFDNTTFATYQTCPRKFEFFILRGLRSKAQSRALVFGQAIHLGLAEWYKTATTPPDEIRAGLAKLSQDIELQKAEVLEQLANNRSHQLYGLIQRLDEFSDAEIRGANAIIHALSILPPLSATQQTHEHRSELLLLNMLGQYFNVYRHEPFQVRYVEQNFVFELWAGGPLYSGIIDLVVDWMGKTCVVEHKTTSSLWNFGEQFNPNQQVSGYLVGLHSLVETTSDFVLINALMVPKRKDKSIKPEDFMRYPGIYRTEEQLQEFLENCVRLYEDIQKDLKRGYFAMNTTACHQYNGCPYREICRTPKAQQHIIIENSYEVDHWKPLERDKV